MVKDMAGPNGLTPALLVFSIILPIPFVTNRIPGQVKRMKELWSAKNEITRMKANEREKLALQRNVLAAAEKEVSVRGKVLMFREKPVTKWVGSYSVEQRHGKSLEFDTGDHIIVASIDKVKRYNEWKAPFSLSLTQLNGVNGDPKSPATRGLPTLTTNGNTHELQVSDQPMSNFLNQLMPVQEVNIDFEFFSADMLVDKIIDGRIKKALKNYFKNAKPMEAEGL